MTSSQHKDDLLPLSQCQRGYLADTGGDPADPMHNTALPLLFATRIPADRLQAALRRLIAMHPMLRTAVVLDAAGQGQHLLSEPEDWWREIDAVGLDRQALLQRAADDLRRPFALARGPFRATLLRGAEVGDLLLLALHHVATDAASWGIIGRDLLACCADPSAAVDPTAPGAGRAYADYVHWEQALLASDRGRRMQDYWQQRLADPGAMLQLPGSPARRSLGRRDARTRGIALTPEQVGALRRCAGRLLTSRFAVLLSVYLLVLARLSAQSDIQVLVPSSMARQQPRFAGMVGLLVSPLVVRLRPASLPDPTFATLARDINLQLLQGLYHQPYPTTDLLRRLLAAKGTAPARPLRAMCAWERSDFIPRHFSAGDLHAERCDIPQLEGLFPIGMTFLEDPDGQAVFGALGHDCAIIPADTADALSAQFFEILDHVTARPDDRLGLARM